jgi:mRNA interferase MazF
MMPININPLRGEIWMVRFDPSEGDEIKKSRPAIVVNPINAGQMRLRIVVPITKWQERFGDHFWIVKLIPSIENSLTKLSSADCFQVKSVSLSRFQRKLGVLTYDEIDEITTTLALCIGYDEEP